MVTHYRHEHHVGDTKGINHAALHHMRSNESIKECRNIYVRVNGAISQVVQCPS